MLEKGLTANERASIIWHVHFSGEEEFDWEWFYQSESNQLVSSALVPFIREVLVYDDGPTPKEAVKVLLDFPSPKAVFEAYHYVKKADNRWWVSDTRLVAVFLGGWAQ